MVSQQTCIALLRGINVGGRHSLPMKDLKLALERAGCGDVRTYIQSGNAVFRCKASLSAQLEKRLAEAIAKTHGFEPHVLVLTCAELARAAADNPFPEAGADPRSLHLFFLAAPPARADLKAIDALRTKLERVALKGRVFYLHAPEGFGTSKLAARAERLLGVEATARNWRTVMALLEMARG